MTATPTVLTPVPLRTHRHLRSNNELRVRTLYHRSSHRCADRLPSTTGGRDRDPG